MHPGSHSLSANLQYLQLFLCLFHVFKTTWLLQKSSRSSHSACCVAMSSPGTLAMSESASPWLTTIWWWSVMRKAGLRPALVSRDRGIRSCASSDTPITRCLRLRPAWRNLLLRRHVVRNRYRGVPPGKRPHSRNRWPRYIRSRCRQPSWWLSRWPSWRFSRRLS